MLKNVLLNDKVILGLIILNSLVIFLSGFDFSNKTKLIIEIVDDLITIVFLFEIIIKFYVYRRDFFRSYWNIFDLILVSLSLPSIMSIFSGNLDLNFDFILVFRVFRVFKSIRFLRFIPGVEHLISGTIKALKSSVFVLIGFAIYIFIIGILSYSIFNNVSPELFENPLKSIYTIFKIFTIEGWYEIPEMITDGMSKLNSFFTISYFIFVVVSGGLFGLSLVNSIFVDAMIEDNNDELNEKLLSIENKLDELTKKLK